MSREMVCCWNKSIIWSSTIYACDVTMMSRTKNHRNVGWARGRVYASGRTRHKTVIYKLKEGISLFVSFLCILRAHCGHTFAGYGTLRKVFIIIHFRHHKKCPDQVRNDDGRRQRYVTIPKITIAFYSKHILRMKKQLPYGPRTVFKRFQKFPKDSKRFQKKPS